MHPSPVMALMAEDVAPVRGWIEELKEALDADEASMPSLPDQLLTTPNDDLAEALYQVGLRKASCAWMAESASGWIKAADRTSRALRARLGGLYREQHASSDLSNAALDRMLDADPLLYELQLYLSRLEILGARMEGRRKKWSNIYDALSRTVELRTHPTSQPQRLSTLPTRNR